MSIPKSILRRETPLGQFYADLPKGQEIQPIPRATRLETLRASRSSSVDLSQTEIAPQAIIAQTDALTRAWCCDPKGILGLHPVYGLNALALSNCPEAVAIKLVTEIGSALTKPMSSEQDQADQLDLLRVLYLLINNPVITKPVLERTQSIPLIAKQIDEISQRTSTDLAQQIETLRAQQIQRNFSPLPAKPDIRFSEQIAAEAKKIASCLVAEEKIPERRERIAAFKWAYDTQHGNSIHHYQAYNPKGEKITVASTADELAELAQADDQAHKNILRATEHAAINARESAALPDGYTQRNKFQALTQTPNYGSYRFPEESPSWPTHLLLNCVYALCAQLSGLRYDFPKRTQPTFDHSTTYFAAHDSLSTLVQSAEDVYQESKAQGTPQPQKDPLFRSLKQQVIHQPDFQQLALAIATTHLG